MPVYSTLSTRSYGENIEGRRTLALSTSGAFRPCRITVRADTAAYFASANDSINADAVACEDTIGYCVS